MTGEERTPGRGALPNLLIIGAAKCGTTSLHYYLDLHPQIGMTREKEPHFFTGREAWNRGLDWYRSLFDPRVEVRGESSVGYTAHPRSQGVPERIHSVIPDARLIYAVRDPIDRILSDYVHRVSQGREERSLNESLKQLAGNHVVERSRYHYQLSQFLPHFPRSRILVLALEDLRKNRRRVQEEMFRFLDVDPTFDSPGLTRVKHRSRFKRRKNRFGLFLMRLAEMPPARFVSPNLRRDVGKILYRPFSRKLERPHLDETLRARLTDYLREDVHRLREFTGKTLSDWSM